MKLDYVKIAMTGFKILAAVVGGVVVVMGINKLTEKKENPVKNNIPVTSNEEIDDIRLDSGAKYEPSEIDKVGAKVINGIRMTQTAMAGIGSIISCLSVIFNTSKNLFSKDYYNNNMINDPSNWSGYYGQQIIPSCPWESRPVLKGTDTFGDNIYWIKRANNVVEVY